MMMAPRQNQSILREVEMQVLVATKERQVFHAFGPRVEPLAVLDTRGIYEALPKTQLAIVDDEDLIAHPFSVAFIRKLLEAAPLRCCTSAEFLASPEAYLGATAPLRDIYKPLPKRTIAFTSYSGGTGKTSFALDTALRLVNRSKRHLQLPVAVFEFTYGGSALGALLGEVKPYLYDLVVQRELEPRCFQGITLYPMDYENVRLLSPEQVQEYCHEQMTHHLLTIIDTIWPHGLASAIGNEVDLWVVLTTPRIDAIENATRLQQEITSTYGENKAIIVVNQMDGLASRLALLGTRHDLEVPLIQRPEIFFDGRLGKEILSYTYGPQWREYQKVRRPHWWSRRRHAGGRRQQAAARLVSENPSLRSE